MPRLLEPRVGLFFGLWCCAVGAIAASADSRFVAAEPSPPVDMQPDRSYPAGTRLRIPKGRASFVIPAGWHAQLPGDSEAILAVSDAGAGFVMVFMILNTTEEELKALLGEPQALTHDLVFEPVGPVVKKGNRLSAAYEAGSLSGRAVTVMGPEQGVLFFLGTPRTDPAETERVLDELADSTEFAVTR
jgi:hypothetical protein